MSTEPGNLADLLQFHPTCAPVSHDLRYPAREAATGDHSTPTCAPVSPESEVVSLEPGARAPPTPVILEPETLRRVLESLGYVCTEVQAIADKATRLQDECSRLRGVLYGIGRIGTEDGLTADEYRQRLLSAVGRATSAGEAQASPEPSSEPHMRAAASPEPEPEPEPEPSPKQQVKIFDMATAPLDGKAAYLHFEDGSEVVAYYRNTFEDGPKAWGTGPSFTHTAVRTPIGWSPVPPTT